MANREDELVLNFANHVTTVGIAIADEGMSLHERINGVSAATTGMKAALKGFGPITSGIFRSLDEEGFTSRDAVAVSFGFGVGLVAGPLLVSVGATSVTVAGLSMGIGLAAESIGESIYDEFTAPGSTPIKPGNFSTAVTTFHVNPGDGSYYRTISQITDVGPSAGRLKTWVVDESGRRELVNDVLVERPAVTDLSITESIAEHNSTSLGQALLSAGLENPQLLLPNPTHANSLRLALSEKERGFPELFSTPTLEGKSDDPRGPDQWGSPSSSNDDDDGNISPEFTRNPDVDVWHDVPDTTDETGNRTHHVTSEGKVTTDGHSGNNSQSDPEDPRDWSKPMGNLQANNPKKSFRKMICTL